MNSQNMEKRHWFRRLSRNRRIITIVAGAAAIMLAGSLIDFSSSDTGPAMREYVLAWEAARAYGLDLKTKGLPVPASVTLGELIKLGLVDEMDVSGLYGMDAEISLATKEVGPMEKIMRVRLPDGDEIAAMGDGSVRQRNP
ncbi:MAG: hypothetical protein O2960_22185 [Verrucomicrobia bacterium]|nr:hypothetical protein [Verrucomicrobiota bacterium]